MVLILVVLVLVFFELREQLLSNCCYGVFSLQSQRWVLFWQCACLLSGSAAYLFIHYAVLVAYVAHSSDIVSQSLGTPLYVHHNLTFS
jgi:hypothetical protein